MLILLAALAAQQPDTLALLRAAQSIPAGQRVRVELFGGRRLVGEFQAVGPNGIEIADSLERRQMALADVTRLWQRKRAIGAGAVVGSVVGAGVGGFFGLLVAGLCDSGDCPSYPGGIVVGGLIGAGLGAGAGGIVGAAIPRWSLRYRSGRSTGGAIAMPVTVGDSTAVRAPRRRVGEFTAMGGAGYGGHDFVDPLFTQRIERQPMIGAEVGLGFRAGPIALGPEASIWSGKDQSMWTLGGMARLYVGDEQRARIAPHLVAGLGAHQFRADMGTGFSTETTLLTLAAGAGLTTAAGWRLEARWHEVIQNNFYHPSFLSVGIGRRFIW